MCGGAIISDLMPPSSHGGGKRRLCAADLWPQVPAAAGQTHELEMEFTVHDMRTGKVVQPAEEGNI